MAQVWQALQDGRSVDTSMGLTPTGGIPMGTRSGDLDPGVLIYLMRAKAMAADALEQLLNHDSGLRGISGGTADMRDLTAASERGDETASLGIAIFCRAIAKFVAGYATALGGLDELVFTGGIGERSAAVRAAVCDRLAFLGVDLSIRNRTRSTAQPSPPHKARLLSRSSKARKTSR